MNSKFPKEAPSQPASKNGAKKILVRNCRSAPPVPSQNKAQCKEVPADVRPSTSEVAPEPEKINLKEPQPHTTLKMKENLKKMKAGMKSVRFDTKVSSEPRTKATKKVNIRFDEKIYKDLVDLRVSEDDLGLRPISTGKPKDLTAPRDPVPQLSDYYQPKFDKEYVVKPHPPTFKIKKSERPAHCSSSVLEAVKRWSIDDHAV